MVIGALMLAAATVKEIGPEANLCAEINALTPGGELVLRPGDYSGPCTISRSGAPGAPITVRAKDLALRPRVAYGGTEHNVINVRASHVTLRGLHFGPTERDVDAVTIRRGSHIVIEECLFDRVGGISVSANRSSSQGIMVRRNEFAEPRATALYLGCHDGSQCEATGLVVEGNFIHGVDAPEGEVGYGM